MQKLMLEWADEFEGLHKDVFYELGTNVRNACEYIMTCLLELLKKS